MKQYRSGVFALILDDQDRILIIQKHGYSEHDWTLIGGGREPGEDILTNLRRELSEETGLESECYKLCGIGTNKHRYDYPAEISGRINGGAFTGQEYDICILRIKPDAISQLSLDTTEIKTHQRINIEEMSVYLRFPYQYQNFKQALDSVMAEG